jgi:hypothetical protein
MILKRNQVKTQRLLKIMVIKEPDLQENHKVELHLVLILRPKKILIMKQAMMLTLLDTHSSNY